MNRTERLFAIAELLRARRTGITAEELAEHFEVSVRTIYRDLDSLRTADLPVRGERGRGGGLALDSAYNLPPVNFTAREAAVLVAAGRWLERSRIMPFVGTLGSALRKVQAALPTARQRELSRLERTLSFVGVPARAPAPEVRQTVERAWLDQLPVWIAYDGARGRTERTVRIDAVIMERTVTLLNCFDLDKQADRQFHLHLIAEARVAD